MRNWDFDLSKRCDKVRPVPGLILEKFSCGNEEIDSFFHHDAFLYENEMMSKTYSFIDRMNENRIVSMFSLSNDSIKTNILTNSVRNRLQRNIPNKKRKQSYPAVLIGQLGVDLSYRGLRIGHQVLEYIKKWMTHPENKTGCRFLVIDALNVGEILLSYEKNGFKYLYPSEADERDARNIIDVRLKSRSMYCDLREWIHEQIASY